MGTAASRVLTRRVVAADGRIGWPSCWTQTTLSISTAMHPENPREYLGIGVRLVSSTIHEKPKIIDHPGPAQDHGLIGNLRTAALVCINPCSPILSLY